MEKKRIFSKEYWTEVFLIGLPIFLIVEGIKITFVTAILLKMSFPLKETNIFIGQMVSALLLLFNGVGLITKRNWARKLIFAIFPVYAVYNCCAALFIPINPIMMGQFQIHPIRQSYVAFQYYLFQSPNYLWNLFT